MTPQETSAIGAKLADLKCSKPYAQHWIGEWAFVFRDLSIFNGAGVLAVAHGCQAAIRALAHFPTYRLEHAREYTCEYQIKLFNKEKSGPECVVITREILFTPDCTGEDSGVPSRVNINPATQLFEGLHRQEAHDLLNVATRASKDNDCDHSNRYFRFFIRHTAPGDNEPLRHWSVFVSKAALSAAIYFRDNPAPTAT